MLPSVRKKRQFERPKKKIDQEKKDVERKRAEKKEQEKLKKTEERVQKEAEKATAKAEQEKLANQKRAAEQSEKQRVENEAEVLRKMQESKQMVLERDRCVRVELMEKMQSDWLAVVQLAKDIATQPAVAAMLVAAHEKEGEDKLDAELACLGSFFILGVRPSQESPVLSSSLRNRVKKLRTRLRLSAGTGELFDADLKGVADHDGLQKTLIEVVNGIIVEAENPVSQREVSENTNPVEGTAGKKKKKSKAQEEDLDALIAEFGTQSGDKSKSKKNKKK